jgi:hypothetical protein
MTDSIKEHFKHHPTQESIELKRMFNAVVDQMDALTAKIDAQNVTQNAAVTSSALDTDFAATISADYIIK